QRYLDAEEQLHENCERNGLPYALVEELSGRPTGFRIERAALDGKGESYTMDGSAASAKLLGDLDTFVLGRASLHVQPNMWFHAMGDHVVTFSLLPLAADKTLVRTTWLVAPTPRRGSTTTSRTSRPCGSRQTSRMRTSANSRNRGCPRRPMSPGPMPRPNRRSMTLSPGTSNGSRPTGTRLTRGE